MKEKGITLEKLRRPVRIKKLNHEFDEIDESLAIEMRNSHYDNYKSSPRIPWKELRFDYRYAWIVRAQKVRSVLGEREIVISSRRIPLAQA